ncbi:MAG: uroporphyrinogen decarboxylase family protein [Anaerolineae bacterium]
MNSLERVRRALHWQYPDRIPLVFRGETARSDIINVGYATPSGWEPALPGLDEWGRCWANIAGTGLGQIIDEPLTNPSLDGYRFPDPCDASRYIGLAETVRQYPDRYIAASLGLSGFTCMMGLRGFENLMFDFYDEPQFIEQLADAVFGFEAAVIAEYARRGVHGVWLFDDLGTDAGPMMSPNLFRRVFAPRYTAQARMVHSLGMDYLLHSCGDIWALIPDLIEVGFDLLNLEQPSIFGTPDMNGIDRLAAAWGGRICFCTNVDSQRTLITGPIAAIEAEAQHVVRALARPEGGLIILANCGQDHHLAPPEHINAQVNAFVRLAEASQVGARHSQDKKITIPGFI